MHTVTPLYSCFVYQTAAINFPKILYIVFKFTNGCTGFYVIK